MNCPEELADSVLEIIRCGVLRIRAAAWQNDADRCGVEADHIHNLPSLLAEFSLERLRYYVETEKPCFTDRTGNVSKFKPHWEKLTEYLEHQATVP